MFLYGSSYAFQVNKGRKIPSISFASTPLLALLSVGRITGLVIDCGQLESTVLPVSPPSRTVYRRILTLMLDLLLPSSIPSTTNHPTRRRTTLISSPSSAPSFWHLCSTPSYPQRSRQYTHCRPLVSRPSRDPYRRGHRAHQNAMLLCGTTNGYLRGRQAHISLGGR